MSDGNKKMAIIALRGTLDWAYPPFILGSTAAAFDMDVQIFFSFYGLPLLKKKISAQVAPIANPAMPMPVPMPNMVMANMPGLNAFAASMMKSKFKSKGVASLEELRDSCIEMGVKLVACQMTLDVFGFDKSEFIDGVEFAGAATFIEYASTADITLAF